jgi:hypothetical protein
MKKTHIYNNGFALPQEIHVFWGRLPNGKKSVKNQFEKSNK